MKTFEDELLAELRAVVSEREVAPRRSFVRRHRVAVGLAACATLAVAGTVTAAVVGGERTTSPAYSVTEGPDGKVTITIYNGEDGEGIERRLAQAGVTAEVTEVPVNQSCVRTPEGIGFDGYWSSTDNWDGHQAHGHSWTLKPADFVDATLLIETRSYGDHRGVVSEFGFVKTGSFGPCSATE